MVAPMSKGLRGARNRAHRIPRAVAAPIDSMQQAWTHFRGGRPVEAEPLCRKVLERHPHHPGALTLLGVIAAQGGRTAEAAGFLGRAAELLPDDPEAQNNHGNALRDLGRLLDALSCYERALALKPDFAEAHYNRGLALYDLRQTGQAIGSFDRAIGLRPHYAAAWNSRGTAFRALGRFAEALASYDRAVALQPAHAEAHNNRGATLHGLERYPEALASYARALALRPDGADAHNNRGVTLRALKRFDEALVSFDRALTLKPRYADAYTNRGVTQHELERHDEALASFALALEVAPDSAAAHCNRGVTLQSLRRLDEASACYDRALQINPNFADAHFNRGVLLQELGHFHDALTSYDRALNLGRQDCSAYRNHATVLQALKYSEEAIASYERALALDPQARFLLGACRHARMQVCDWSEFESGVRDLVAGIERGEPLASPFVALSLIGAPAVQRQAAEIWVREECSPRERLPPPPRHPRHERIRIGYFSADFRNHAVAALAAELFETHDRSRFELTAFALGADVHDELRTRVEAAFDRFLCVGGRSDHEIAALARSLEIDIAIDLGGYTLNARPRIMALRAAPIQASYLGYLGTMGGAFMDYLLADPVLVPAESRDHYCEKIAYLPSYQVNDSKRPCADRTFTRAELGLPPTGFVFCCFNASYKITPATFECWMRILSAVPGSVLFLLGNAAATQRNLRREAVRRGVAADRLIFGTSLPFGDYLARYQAADLFLDTLPYNAGTTASDALWTGLPVLTCRGDAFQSRMAASLLTAIDLPELITADFEEYERLAIEIATQPQRHAALKRLLADNRRGCALFDTVRFTHSLERLYELMYQRHLAGLAPDHLAGLETGDAARVGSEAAATS